MNVLLRAVLVLAVTLSAYAGAAAEPKHEAGKAGPKPEQMQMSVVTLTVMVKDAIIALHQANMTGNYSVLRDMGSPVFRENFDQTRLAAVFANLRARQINLSPAYFLSPNLTKQPEITKDNELALTGFFPTQPLQIQFDLRFIQLDGKWRLAGMAVDAVAPSAAQASVAAPAEQPSASQNAKRGPGKPKS